LAVWGEAQPRYFHSFAGAPQARVVSCVNNDERRPANNQPLEFVVNPLWLILRRWSQLTNQGKLLYFLV